MVPRKQAGHMTCTRPQAERQILLATRASSTHDPTQTSALRHPGQPHALNGVVAPGKEGRIVAPCICGITKATNGEAWIERKSRLHRGPRFVQLPEPHQHSREKEMRGGIIS